MASSRSSAPAESAAAAGAPAATLRSAGASRAPGGDTADPIVAATLIAVRQLRVREPAAGARPLSIAVGFSGGLDSMVLLDALASLPPEHAVSVAALHVHHGLSPNAERWAEFCAAECARRGVPLTVHRASIRRAAGESLEAVARAARHAAFAAVDADVVALAHHADDQAETLLLQLLRGAGPQGLAAMPVVNGRRRPALVRPLLALPRTLLADYARRRELRWIEDESNADTQLRRNFLRHEVTPRLAAAFPGYPATLARSAAHSAEAAELLDELAALDAATCRREGDGTAATLDRSQFRQLIRQSPARARNLLRWFLRGHALPPPSTDRLAAMLAQLELAGDGARVRLAHAGYELGIHQGRMVVHAPAVAAFAQAWSGEPALALPHGTLHFVPAVGAGIASARLRGAGVSVRQRLGGESLRLAANRPERSLKKLLQEARIAPWLRASLPLVYCDDRLAAVPGVGVDAPFQAAAGEDGLVLRWDPAPET